MIEITHTHRDGTLVSGTERGDGTAEILKAARFRWFPSLKLWGIPQSRDHLAKRWQIGQAAEALRAAGHEVTVSIDDTPRDVADVKADRAGRLDGRRDALQAKAERNMASAIAHEAAATEIAERRPLGQPILIGHHSERAARADQRRIERHMGKFCEDYGKAKRYDRAARAVGRADAYREHAPVIIRRIAAAEADLRKCQRNAAAYGDTSGHYAARITFLQHQLAADREALTRAEEAGYRCHSRDTVHVGDLIQCGGGAGRKVVRVSAKSVSVESGYSWTDRVSYERITRVICTHGQQASA